MVWIWLALLIVFIVVEIATVQIVTIWFAAGALASLITSLLTENLVIQGAVFLTTSLLSLVFTRPLVKKLMKNDVQPTNADRYIGKEGFVTEEINNILGTGSITVSGVTWTARSYEDSIIPKDTKVVIEKISGVKAIVKISNI
ncbi:MAG: NfeD family protein [Clostridiales bacterium]|jgi:membrane protein implicated in regulation of membrane protease activity|nr:NfeD family protein [Clostridiales bacterium]